MREADGDGRTTPGFEPTRLIEIELSEHLPALAAYQAGTTRHYRRAQALVRLHSRPLGLVGFSLSGDSLGPELVANRIWEVLQAEVNEHLRQDGLKEVTALGPEGLESLPFTTCVEPRASCLASAPPASVIVCTRDRSANIAQCLPALVALHYPRYEIIIVDNAPKTDETLNFVQEHYGGRSDVKYVREDRPGLSWARNRGLRYAEGAIVAYIDDDAVADQYWLAEHAAALQLDTDVACATGMTLPAELETQAQLWYQQFSGFSKGRGFGRRTFNMTTHRPHDPLFPYLAAHFGAGVNMSYKTSVLRDLHGFDPALGAGTPARGGEDIDMFFRIISSGYTLVYEPGALQRHFDRREYTGLRKQLYGYGVAFTAFLAKCMADDPGRLLHLVRQLPYGLSYLLSAESARNKQKRYDYPRALTRVELSGMVVGPVAYLGSRWQRRRITQQFGPLDVVPE